MGQKLPFIFAAISRTSRTQRRQEVLCARWMQYAFCVCLSTVYVYLFKGMRKIKYIRSSNNWFSYALTSWTCSYFKEPDGKNNFFRASIQMLLNDQIQFVIWTPYMRLHHEVSWADRWIFSDKKHFKCRFCVINELLKLCFLSELFSFYFIHIKHSQYQFSVNYIREKKVKSN